MSDLSNPTLSDSVNAIKRRRNEKIENNSSSGSRNNNASENDDAHADALVWVWSEGMLLSLSALNGTVLSTVDVSPLGTCIHIYV